MTDKQRVKEIIKYVRRHLDTIEQLLEEPEPEEARKANLIVGRYYWVQFYEVGSWELGKWSEYGDFDTAHFCQDWYHPGAIRWVLIPTADELLGAIGKPKPESLASSVLRLTNICNELSRENATLRNDLTDRNQDVDILKKRVESLRAPCSKVMADAGVTELRASNVMLLRRNKKLEEDLSMADAHIEELQADIAKQDLCRANTYIKELQRTLEELGLR